MLDRRLAVRDGHAEIKMVDALEYPAALALRAVLEVGGAPQPLLWPDSHAELANRWLAGAMAAGSLSASALQPARLQADATVR